MSYFAGLRLRHGQDDPTAQAAPVHLAEDVGGFFEGPPGNVGTYVVGGGELEGVTDVLRACLVKVRLVDSLARSRACAEDPSERSNDRTPNKLTP